jgi:DNA helicase-2/ATP-dependent DNA helicase PcrA
VFHQKFGYGTVQGVDDDKLDVAFRTGVKRILDRFVEKA